jgi:glycosyltransferase involved in cell wall biosynthesis
MKILLTSHQFFPQYTAGTEVLTNSVARELIRRGHSVHVFTGHPSTVTMREEDRFDEYEHDGIHVYRFHHAYVPMAGQQSMIEVGYDNHLASSYFERLLENFKPDVVHFFHLNRLGTGLILSAAQADIPRFLTPTDFWLVCPTGQLLLADASRCTGPSAHAGNCIKHLAQNTQKGLVGKAAKWLPTTVADLLGQLTKNGVLLSYPKSHEVMAIASRLDVNIARLNQLSGIVAPNEFMRALLIRHGVSPHLIELSTFGIDMSSSAEGVPRTTVRSPLRVGFIGTLAPHKGCHVLIDGIKRLPTGCATLKIYGNPGEFPDYANDLKQSAARHPSVNFCGTFPNADIAQVMSELDVLVVPSLWYENTPLVLYSAQAACCPVVASNLPGISEVILDDVNGLLFEAGNDATLTRLLSRLIDERGLLQRLSANTRRPKSTANYVDELLHMWETA